MNDNIHEINYNSNVKYPLNVKRGYIVMFTIIVCLGLAVLTLYLLIPKIISFGKILEPGVSIAVVTAYIAVLGAAFELMKMLIRYVSLTKKTLAIAISINQNVVTITCKIGNKGLRRIIPNNVFLIVEEGLMEKDGISYSFPDYFVHIGKDDCQMSKLCQDDKCTCNELDKIVLNSYKGIFRKIVRLNHLCSETRMFLDPGEDYFEDVTLLLPKGIYRASVVWISKNEDCICGARNFVV